MWMGLTSAIANIGCGVFVCVCVEADCGRWLILLGWSVVVGCGG